MHCGISGRDVFSAIPVRYLSACLEAGWSCAIAMLSQRHVVCCDLVNFGHELILCHSWNEAEKKKTRSMYEVCIQIWVLLPWQGICHEILFSDDKGKWKGRTKRKRARMQSRERCTSSLNSLPDQGLVITIFSPSAPSQLCWQSSKLDLINGSSLSQA